MKKHLVVEIENAEEFEKLYNDYLKKLLNYEKQFKS